MEFQGRPGGEQPDQCSFQQPETLPEADPEERVRVLLTRGKEIAAALGECWNQLTKPLEQAGNSIGKVGESPLHTLLDSLNFEAAEHAAALTAEMRTQLESASTSKALFLELYKGTDHFCEYTVNILADVLGIEDEKALRLDETKANHPGIKAITRKMECSILGLLGVVSRRSLNDFSRLQVLKESMVTSEHTNPFHIKLARAFVDIFGEKAAETITPGQDALMNRFSAMKRILGFIDLIEAERQEAQKLSKLWAPLRYAQDDEPDTETRRKHHEKPAVATAETRLEEGTAEAQQAQEAAAQARKDVEDLRDRLAELCSRFAVPAQHLKGLRDELRKGDDLSLPVEGTAGLSPEQRDSILQFIALAETVENKADQLINRTCTYLDVENFLRQKAADLSEQLCDRAVPPGSIQQTLDVFMECWPKTWEFIRGKINDKTFLAVNDLYFALSNEKQNDT